MTDQGSDDLDTMPFSISDRVRGERALEAGDADYLGFGEVAERLADALIHHGIEGSLVIGLEGRWGSGKTSLLNLVEQRLADRVPGRPHSIVHFRPWLIGDRDALLGSLFSELSTEIDRIEYALGDATRQTRALAESAAGAIRAFAVGLAKVGSLAEAVGDATAIAPIKLAGRVARSVGEAAAPGKPLSLDTLKTKLVKALKALNHRIIVTIDDLDRLEPREVVEVLRLVRSVADFPNVIYLLCYDSDVLAKSIQRATQVEDGHAFLEKIVQLTLMVPQPETFQLRHWFGQELQRFATPTDEEGAERLRTVIDTQGGTQLDTPRAVNRALDTLRLLWPTLRRQGADLADLVWLQLIKNGNPLLYRWIEEYCAVAAEASLGTARVDDEQRAVMLKGLTAAAGPDAFSSIYSRHAFAAQLPGLEELYKPDGDAFSLFGKVPMAERDRAIAARRLASPDHYRLYFSLTNPTHSLHQAEYDNFWRSLDEGPSATIDFLLKLHQQPTSRSLGKADMLLIRIGSIALNQLTAERARVLLLAFSSGMDEMWSTRPFERGWYTSLWDLADRMIRMLMDTVDIGERSAVVEEMFSQGTSMSWLTTVFRRETFAHGIFGDQSKPEEAWSFDAARYGIIARIMIERYRRLTLEDILSTIQPRDVFYAWSQGGDPEEVRALLKAGIESDEGFLRVLEVLQSRTQTSEGTFNVLKRETLEGLLDFDAARSRSVMLVANSLGPEARSRAARLEKSFEMGDHY